MTVTSAAFYPKLNSYQLLTTKKKKHRANELIKYGSASKCSVISLPKRTQNILRTYLHMVRSRCFFRTNYHFENTNIFINSKVHVRTASWTIYTIILSAHVSWMRPIECTAGMGNFDSDEGQRFFSFIPRVQITNPRPHTFYTVLLNFLFIERN